MKRIVFFSDIHLGLQTSDVDRTEEIINVCFDIVKHAVKIKADLCVIGGDVFNNNNPSEFLIGQFIRILNQLQKAKIKTYVMVGNHDAIANPERKSCLDFVKRIKLQYTHVKLVEDIKCFEWFTGDMGPVYLTFLPHITSAFLDGKKYKSVQEYIEKKTKSIWKRVGKGNQQYVFSHLNVPGAVPGSEETLLKKSEAWLPEELMIQETKGKLSPLIVQAHIHTQRQMGNVEIIGSPIYVNFGEKEKEKYFAVVDVPETFGEKQKVNLHKTNCKKFIELNYIQTPKKLISKNKKSTVSQIDSNSIVKINLEVQGDIRCDTKSIMERFEKRGAYVKPVVPRYVRDAFTRDRKQTLDLTPEQAIKAWFKKNRPKGFKLKQKLAMKYLGESVS